MKNLLFISFLIIALVACNQKTVKSKYTQDELAILANNPEFIKQYRDTALVLTAFKAVKLDTTMFKKIHFRITNCCIDYMGGQNIRDSLLENVYGYKIKPLSVDSIFSLYGIKQDIVKIKVTEKSMGLYFKLFNNIIPKIKSKYNKCNNDSIMYESIFWQTQEIMFNNFKKEVQSKIRKKGKNHKKSRDCYYCEGRNLDNITRLNLGGDICDQQISLFCYFKYDTNNCVPPYDITKYLTQKMDTIGMFPIKIVFDTLGNIIEIKPRKAKVIDELLKICQQKYGHPTVKLFNKKPLELEFYVNNQLFSPCKKR